MAYRAIHRPDRWKAMLAAIATTGILGAVIVSGLSVRAVSSAVDALKTFSITAPKPPPPPPPQPPQVKPQPAKHEQGAPARQANPSPVVAPKAAVPTPTRVAAAPVAGTGSASSAGAGTAGNGTGAGGYGNGLGGGGTGAFTPARKISKIPDQEYQRFAALGIPSGVAGVTVRVNPDGSASNCRVARSSGSSAADSLMCQLTLAYVRFSPALDPSGRPIAEDVTFFPNWRHR
jgi:protein TonB